MATLDQPDHGLTEEVLEKTDVLTWWGHKAHNEVEDAIVDRVYQRVLDGMGLIALHSSHFSKIFSFQESFTGKIIYRRKGRADQKNLFRLRHIRQHKC